MGVFTFPIHCCTIRWYLHSATPCTATRTVLYRTLDLACLLAYLLLHLLSRRIGIVNRAAWHSLTQLVFGDLIYMGMDLVDTA